MGVGRKAKEAAGTSKTRRFNGTTVSCTAGGVLEKGEGCGETAAEVPETQPPNSRPSIS